MFAIASARQFNLVEAILWLVIALVFAGQALRPHPLRRPRLLLALAFAMFGISDLIEMRTGSWWEPWWLLALKIACILAIIAGFRALLKPR